MTTLTTLTERSPPRTPPIPHSVRSPSSPFDPPMASTPFGIASAHGQQQQQHHHQRESPHQLQQPQQHEQRQHRPSPSIGLPNDALPGIPAKTKSRLKQSGPPHHSSQPLQSPSEPLLQQPSRQLRRSSHHLPQQQLSSSQLPSISLQPTTTAARSSLSSSNSTLPHAVSSNEITPPSSWFGDGVVGSGGEVDDGSVGAVGGVGESYLAVGGGGAEGVGGIGGVVPGDISKAKTPPPPRRRRHAKGKIGKQRPSSGGESNVNGAGGASGGAGFNLFLGPDDGAIRTPILPVNDQYSHSQLENLYVDLLSTIDFQFGVSASEAPLAGGGAAFKGARRRSRNFEVEAAVDFLQEAFHISKEEHQLLCNRALEKGQEGRLSLRVEIKKAVGLRPKDVTGLNDPYCKLGLTIGGDRKSSLDSLPDDQVKMTKICKKTLDPVWNDLVHFDLRGRDFDESVLRLEIWNESSATKLLQSRFLGRVNLALKEVPSSGLSQWMPLEGRSGKSHVEGSLHICVNLDFVHGGVGGGLGVDVVDSDEGPSDEDYDEDLQKHELLLQLFIDLEIERTTRRSRKGTLTADPFGGSNARSRPNFALIRNGDSAVDLLNPFTNTENLNEAENPFEMETDEPATNPNSYPRNYNAMLNSDNGQGLVFGRRTDADVFASPFDDEDSLSMSNESQGSSADAENAELMWNGEMSLIGVDILRKHANRKGISLIEESVMWWQILLSKYEDGIVSVEAIGKILLKIREAWEENCERNNEHTGFKKMERKDKKNNGNNVAPSKRVFGLDKQQEEMVLRSLREFVDHCMERLLHSSWPSAGEDFQSTLELEEIQHILSCLHVIYSISAFKIANPERDLNNELTSLIKNRLLQKEALSRYYEIRANLQTSLQSKNVGLLVDAMLHLTEFALKEAKNSIKIIRPTFAQSSDVDHFFVTYMTQAKLLAEDLSHGLSELSSSVDYRHAFDVLRRQPPEWIRNLYCLFQMANDYVEHVDKMPPSFSRKQLFILNFRDWFPRDVIFSWLEIARSKAQEMTLGAIQKDKGDFVDDLLKYSSSPVDVKCCFEQVIIHNWRQLCWPDLVDSFPFVSRVVKDVTEVAKFYAVSVYEKAVKEGVFKTQDNLPGIAKNRERQMTVAMNNIETVKEGLQVAMTSLRVQSIIKAIDASHGELEATSCRQEIDAFIRDAETVMEEKVKIFAKFIVQQFLPKLTQFLSQFLPSTTPARGSLGEDPMDRDRSGNLSGSSTTDLLREDLRHQRISPDGDEKTIDGRTAEAKASDAHLAPPPAPEIQSVPATPKKERKFSTFSLKRFTKKSFSKSRQGSVTSLQSLSPQDPFHSPAAATTPTSPSPFPTSGSAAPPLSNADGSTSKGGRHLAPPNAQSDAGTPPMTPSRRNSLKNRLTLGIKGVDMSLKNSLSGSLQSLQSLSHIRKKSQFPSPIFDAVPRVDDEQLMKQLLGDLETTLSGFMDLLPPNLKMLLKEVWREMTAALMEAVEARKGASNIVYQQLSQFLADVKAIVHANGVGLDTQTILLNDVYLPLDKKLNILKMSSENMVEQFHQEMLQEQVTQTKKDNNVIGLGSITVMASYNQAFNKICIEVLNGKEICLPNGEMANAYVKVCLVPKHAFPRFKNQRSNASEKNKFPLFNFSCEFLVPPEICRLPYVGVRIVVMHKTSLVSSQVGNNECCGFAFVAASNLPGLDGKDGGFGDACLIANSASATTTVSARLELPIARVKESGMKEVVEVLKARGSHDKLAQEFWKDYKKHLHLKERITAADEPSRPFSSFDSIRRSATLKRSTFKH